MQAALAWSQHDAAPRPSEHVSTQFQLCTSTITRMLDLMEQPALGSEDAAAVVTLVDRMVETVSYRWGSASLEGLGAALW